MHRKHRRDGHAPRASGPRRRVEIFRRQLSSVRLNNVMRRVGHKPRRMEFWQEWKKTVPRARWVLDAASPMKEEILQNTADLIKRPVVRMRFIAIAIVHIGVYKERRSLLALLEVGQADSLGAGLAWSWRRRAGSNSGNAEPLHTTQRRDTPQLLKVNLRPEKFATWNLRENCFWGL